jgi:hypothetical protein
MWNEQGEQPKESQLRDQEFVILLSGSGAGALGQEAVLSHSVLLGRACVQPLQGLKHEAATAI